MGVMRAALFLAVPFFLMPLSFAASTLRLSQKDVAELVLQKSFRSEEIKSKYEQLRLDFSKAKSLSDWKLSLQTGYETDKTENVQSQYDGRYQRYNTTAQIQKSLLTGTQVTASVSRLSQKTDVTGVTPSTTADAVSFTLEQSLWGLLPGGSDQPQAHRSYLTQSELNFLSQNQLRLNELEDLVLESLRAFWNTYVAQQNLKEAMATRDRYDKLVKSVRQKSALGYASPGELPQVLAEYETRLQNVKQTSLNYLKELDSFSTLLRLDKNSTLDLQAPAIPKNPPELNPADVQSLRLVKSQAQKVQAAEAGLDYAEMKSKSSLSLVGTVASSGVDDNAERSYSELLGGSRNKAYVGVKYAYQFGSAYLQENLQAQRAALALEQVKQKRLIEEQQNQLDHALRNIETQFVLMSSLLKQKDFRKKAVEDLNRAYTQGRTDLRNLIQAMNDLYATELQSIRALGDYQIALNELAALRDELIPEPRTETP